MGHRIKKKFYPVLAILFLVSAACSLPIMQQPTPTIPAPADSAQATLNALMTEIAGGAPVNGTPSSTPGNAVNTQVSTSTQAASTLAPTAILFPTATQVTLPTNTITPVCDQAGFVADITVSDGSVIPAGTSFYKTWRLRNMGSCTWTSDYAVVYDAGSGSGMSAPATQKLGVSVPPGQTADITLTMKAPGSPGQYRDYWRLRNAAGVLFGIGAANERFYVDIKVVNAQPTTSGYDFGANICLATWTGNGKALPCLGKDGSVDGFVSYEPKPVLESGYIDDEPGIVTNPPLVTDGIIRGKFPPYTVKANDRFISIIGCEYNAKKCNVRFQLDYQIDNGSIQTLGSWNEVYEGGVSSVNIDISSLAGKNVAFILTVFANGASEQDRGLWLLPRIAQPEATSTPAPTATRTPTPTLTFTQTPTPTSTVSGYPYP